MKKALLFCLLLSSSLIAFAQKTDSLNNLILSNELKINVLYGIEGRPEMTYERVVRRNMGIGASLFVAGDKSQQYKFGFMPYYRIYFGKKRGNGLFIEGNAGIITLEDDYYVDVAHNYKITTTDLTLGFAVGAKYLNSSGFFIETYLGGGKLVAYRIGYYTREFPRNGIVIGKRF